MGKVYQNYLDCDRLYLCNNCNCHLADHDHRVSKVCRLQLPILCSIANPQSIPIISKKQPSGFGAVSKSLSLLFYLDVTKCHKTYPLCFQLVGFPGTPRSSLPLRYRRQRAGRQTRGTPPDNWPAYRCRYQVHQLWSRARMEIYQRAGTKSEV